jgi:glucose/arabinose dehydrogenase
MNRRPRQALLAFGGAIAGAALIAACGGPGAPNWKPQPNLSAAAAPAPELTGPDLQPGTGTPTPGQPGQSASPGQSTPGQSPGQSPSPGQTSPSPSGSSAVDPSVVATNLASPVGMLILPDGTALVGERTTGRIVKVQPVAGQPVQTVATLDGIDASSDGGLLDLALSPTYAQDGLILAYITTATDNRVVHFSIGGPATPILTGIPKGATGNAGRIAFDGAGHLLVATGDAGNPALAADKTSLAGKILRTDDLGRPAPDNPSPTSPIWATGPVGATGLCVDSASGDIYVAASGPDAVYQVTAGSVFAGTGAAAPSATVPSTWSQAGGCAIGNDALYLATAAGQALIKAPLLSSSPTPGTFTAVLSGKYGRLRTVVYAPDGALWLTTGNTEPGGTPGPQDERVIRILDTSGGGGGGVV